MTKKAIIFDLYDTLVKINTKTNPYLYLLSQTKDMKYNCKVYIDYVLMDNFTPEDLQLFFGVSNEVITEFNRLVKIETDSVETIAGTYRTLTRLSEKYRLFLLSNLATPYKEPFHKLNLARYFEKAFFSCDEGDKKPNASFFKKIINSAKLKPEECVMVGDNMRYDVQAARSLGMDGLLRYPNISLDVITNTL